MKAQQEYIVLFDGICLLCNNFAKFIKSKNKQHKFIFVDILSDRGQDLLESYKLPTDNLNSMVLIYGDKFLVKSSAVLKVIKESDGIIRLLYLFILIPKPFRDFVYDIISTNRFRISGKADRCPID